jgi:hypothetical protein
MARPRLYKIAQCAAAADQDRVTRQNRHARRYLSFVGLHPDNDTTKEVLSVCRLMGMEMVRAYDQGSYCLAATGARRRLMCAWS